MPPSPRTICVCENYFAFKIHKKDNLTKYIHEMGSKYKRRIVDPVEEHFGYKLVGFLCAVAYVFGVCYVA